MPGMSGLELQLELKNRGSTIPILFLTGHGDMAAAVMALKRGAADFVAKPIEPEVLQSSVRNLVHWHCSLCRELDMRRKARERFNTLTPKEQEICRRIAAGALNKQTAIDLNISEQTVKTHRANLSKKLGLRSAIEIAEFLKMLDNIPNVIFPITAHRD